MKWLILLSIFFTTHTPAEVSPQHVDQMLDQMVKENVVSKEEAEKAKIRMRSMSPDQWGQINKQAAQIANRSPASVSASSNKIQEVHKIDLDGAQFKQIQDDLKKIVPQYNN